MYFGKWLPAVKPTCISVVWKNEARCVMLDPKIEDPYLSSRTEQSKINQQNNTDYE